MKSGCSSRGVVRAVGRLLPGLSRTALRRYREDTRSRGVKPRAPSRKSVWDLQAIRDGQRESKQLLVACGRCGQYGDARKVNLIQITYHVKRKHASCV